MATTKPQSTISYNSESFLQGALKSLVKANVAKFACYVRHIGEDDESHKKDHYHVYIEPCRRVETFDLKNRFIEVVPNDNPLGCITFRDSKWRDWYLYAKHDIQYLETKGLTRKYHYDNSDFWSTDDLYFQQMSFEIEEQKTPYDDIVKAIENGVSVEQYIFTKKTPIPQIENVKRAYTLVRSVMNSYTVSGIAKATGNANDYFVFYTNGKTDSLVFHSTADIANFLNVGADEVMQELIDFQGNMLLLCYNRKQNNLVQNYYACNVFGKNLYGVVLVADYSMGYVRSVSPHIIDIFKQFA